MKFEYYLLQLKIFQMRPITIFNGKPFFRFFKKTHRTLQWKTLYNINFPMKSTWIDSHPRHWNWRWGRRYLVSEIRILRCLFSVRATWDLHRLHRLHRLQFFVCGINQWLSIDNRIYWNNKWLVNDNEVLTDCSRDVIGAVGRASALLSGTGRLLSHPRLHRHRHVVRELPHKDATVARHADEMLAVVGEAQTRHQLGMAVHGGHALARVVIVHCQSLIRAACGHVEAAVVQT